MTRKELQDKGSMLEPLLTAPTFPSLASWGHGPETVKNDSFLLFSPYSLAPFLHLLYGTTRHKN